MLRIVGKREVNKQVAKYAIINYISGLKMNFLAPACSPSTGQKFIQKPDSRAFVFGKYPIELPRESC